MMKVIIGIISAVGTLLMFSAIAAESITAQNIHCAEWNYKFIILALCIVISWLSFSKDKDTTKN